jgi:hypothetical protein
LRCPWKKMTMGMEIKKRGDRERKENTKKEIREK